MRRRWRWQWTRDETRSITEAIGFMWCGGGFVGVVVALVASADYKHDRVTTTGWLALVVWLAPMCVVLATITAYDGLVRLWRNPPLRRVAEPVPKDLRAAAVTGRRRRLARRPPSTWRSPER